MYNPKDFAANPGKYRLFKTAAIARHVFTENGAQDIPEGQIVKIEFRCIARNRLFRRDEPVYTVNDSLDLYANVLKDFCL